MVGWSVGKRVVFGKGFSYFFVVLIVELFVVVGFVVIMFVRLILGVIF